MVVDEMTLETNQVVQLDLLHIRWVPSPIFLVPAWIFHELADIPQQVERYMASRGWCQEGAIERHSVPREGLMYQHWAMDNYLPCFLRFWQLSANSKTLHWEKTNNHRLGWREVTKCNLSKKIKQKSQMYASKQWFMSSTKSSSQLLGGTLHTLLCCSLHSSLDSKPLMAIMPHCLCHHHQSPLPSKRQFKERDILRFFIVIMSKLLDQTLQVMPTKQAQWRNFVAGGWGGLAYSPWMRGKLKFSLLAYAPPMK